ncbi:hypothetical protein SPSIL_051890 [Sporomusa silvacetica DSM 10669]|uniref:Metallo-beta-lactamase domain-containing protein n=1 Tax=Sporomusa silvacetica DSM 10669 TaxID=1123289 RepID=A0ABZ3ITD1_9FIRM|nr:MBL fold metallo-hydrolase [Sporomusa silvacetica]OZC14080.1 putative metallo-hydrolase YflN [Sporomusa silvacetica DSM 10669]
MSKITPLTFGMSKLHIIEDRGNIIVDTGCIEEKEKYEAAFAEIGIDPKTIELIILSHGHWDHYARANELKELTGAPVLCHKNALPAIQTGKNSPMSPRGEMGKRFLELIAHELNVQMEPVVPDIVIDSTYDLAPFGVAGKIIYTPGHSECSVSVLLDSGEAIVGDMIIDSPFTNIPCLSLIVSDEAKLRDSLRTLLKTTHTFYGGHSGPYTKEVVASLIEKTE